MTSAVACRFSDRIAAIRRLPARIVEGCKPDQAV
jgi:hypothetical protein